MFQTDVFGVLTLFLLPLSKLLVFKAFVQQDYYILVYLFYTIPQPFFGMRVILHAAPCSKVYILI